MRITKGLREEKGVMGWELSQKQKQQIKDVIKWVDSNKWFVLACVVLLYGAWSHRYQYLTNGVMIDRWTQKVVRVGVLMRQQAEDGDEE